ncbi:hypothetical protein DSO57_1026557 [Entomophthora muscae]|uniref:Uncharacterized protein n=1 Tax=Entomophthora muscae TaxID=34485 RepID=A0ACC2SQY7_9FUNG|nr:hypothetical protein DSO57_1026557 [Entomophthora muscae]
MCLFSTDALRAYLKEALENRSSAPHSLPLGLPYSLWVRKTVPYAWSQTTAS